MEASPNVSRVPDGALELLGKLGLELAFVEPDKDAGLLPLNSLLMDLEELLTPRSPPAVSTGMATARRWLDEILDGPGKFTPEAISNLSAWHAWMTAALHEWGRAAHIPSPPAAWASPQSAPAVTPRGGPGPAPPAAREDSLPAEAAEPTIRLKLDADSELINEFHGESLDLLQTIEQGVLKLEETPGDSGTVHAIFRAFHTFKGGAGFLHLDALRDLAHDLESVLDAVRRSTLSLTSETIELILAGADALRQFTREIGSQLQGTSPGAPITVATRALRQRARALLAGGRPPAAAVSPAPAAPASLPATLPVNAPSPAPAPPPAATGVVAPVGDPVSKIEGATGFVKLDTRKLDNLVDLVGELVIAQSMVVQDPDVQRLSSRHLSRCLRQLSRVTTELQRTAMSLRMVPIRRTFQKMTRLVRDLAARQDKQVQLLLEGEETELDRNIVEELSDPLVHMIRNAVDHGIEAPAERAARGKPPLGTIRLTASHQRGGIVIEIRDDGQGLNAERILARARERGLVGPAATPAEAELFGFIFAPGFSTAEKVTDVSGRGVGMDVVRRNIDKLRGKVEISSSAGEGTVFTIVLPLTLAIIDGMLVGVGDERFIIPTLSVRESFRPRPGMVSTVHGRGEMVSVRGRLTPLLRLGDHLRTPARVEDPTDGIVVVVESGDAARGLLVDSLLGKQEVVIKNLGETFRRQNLLAGAAILGDGRVGLILDVDSLVRCKATMHDN